MFYHALSAEELQAICIDARHAKTALDVAANRTDANDADGPGRWSLRSVSCARSSGANLEGAHRRHTPRCRRVRDRPSRAVSLPSCTRLASGDARRRDLDLVRSQLQFRKRRASHAIAKVMIGANAEEIAFPGSAWRLLDVADAVHTVSGDLGERGVGCNRTCDHLHRQRGLVAIRVSLGHGPHPLARCRSANFSPGITPGR